MLTVFRNFYAGPMFFYGTDNAWLEGGDNGCYGTDCWNWSPEWKGNYMDCS